MLFNSSYEFIAVVVFLLLQFIIRRNSNHNILPGWLLLIGSIAIISTVITPITIGVHLIISAGIFWVSQVISRSKSKGKSLVVVSILALILLFCIRNYPKAFGIDSFQLTDSPSTLIGRLGISYIMFRHIRYLVNIFKKKIQPDSLSEYFNFILFFPNFLAGPIDTYKNFKHWRNNPSLKQKKALILPGIGRITLGFIKKYLLVPLIFTYATNYGNIDFISSEKLALLTSLAIYSTYIYIDFSGYSDIAIGTGYLLGIKTPENFNNPYFSSNISDFWRRWHITFSDFLRDLIFIPLVKWINKLNLKLPRLGVSSIGYIITFAICGIWHGDTVNFLYWGLWHGLGLIIFKLWSSTGFFTKLHNQNNSQIQKGIVSFSGVIITFIFVTIGWMFFHYKGSDLTAAVNLLLS